MIDVNDPTESVAVLILAGLVIGFVLSAPAPGAEVENRIEELNQQAYQAFQRKDFRHAEELAARAWQLAENEGDRLQAGLAAANTAAGLAIHRRMDDALAWYEKAQVRLEESGRARLSGRLAAAKGAVLYLEHDTELGVRELRRAAALLGEDDWRLQFLVTTLELWSDLDLGPVFEKVRSLAERARQSGDPGRLAPALMVLGWIEAAQGGGEYAVELYREAIGLFEERGDAASVALAHRNIGVAYLRVRDFARARAELEKGLEEARRAGDVRLEFAALNDLGVAYALAGESGRALTADREAEEVIAGLADDLRQDRRADTLLVDFYHLLRMRYLTLPALLLDPFPFILDQLALDPEVEEGGGPR